MNKMTGISATIWVKKHRHGNYRIPYQTSDGELVDDHRYYKLWTAIDWAEYVTDSR